MITAIAIDDEPLALQVIEKFCQKTEDIRLVKTFTETTEALEYLKQETVDLLFLDIQMPSLSGIDFVKLMPSSCMTIFTTAYSMYAIEGFNHDAVDYLLKPFEPERFMKAVDKARVLYQMRRREEEETRKYIFLKADYSNIKVLFNDIFYIESRDNYLKIHLLNASPLVVRMSMKAILEKLPSTGFIRVHKSFIVPINQIISVRNKTIYLKNSTIPVGALYTEGLQQAFK